MVQSIGFSCDEDISAQYMTHILRKEKECIVDIAGFND